MSYTISIEPNRAPGKVTAHSSDGYSLTNQHPTARRCRYWLELGAPSTASIVTIWSSGPGHWSLRSTIGFAASKTVREGSRDTPYVTDWTSFPTD
jgi:hypothetical protein